MKSAVKHSTCGLGLLLAAALIGVAAPSPSTNDYRGISSRNMFGLKPAQPTVVEPPTPPLPKVILTGVITAILGNDRALLKEQIAPAGTGGAAREVSMILAEGQREGDIEVVEIDEQAETVRITNCGTPMTLTVEKDGAKLPATRPPVAVPPAPPPSPPRPQGSGAAPRTD